MFSALAANLSAFLRRFSQMFSEELVLIRHHVHTIWKSLPDYTYRRLSLGFMSQRVSSVNDLI